MIRRFSLVLLVTSFIISLSLPSMAFPTDLAKAQPKTEPVYKDSHALVYERVADLMSRMTLEEKRCKRSALLLRLRR